MLLPIKRQPERQPSACRESIASVAHFDNALMRIVCIEHMRCSLSVMLQPQSEFLTSRQVTENTPPHPFAPLEIGSNSAAQKLFF